MGALTSNRKRGDDYFTFNYKFPSLQSPHIDLGIDTHISKKPKFSPSMQTLIPDRPVFSRSTALRIPQYPGKIRPINREIHAPCRASKFRVFPLRPSSSDVSKRDNSADVKMGIILSKYENARSEAFGSLRFCGKDKKVIDVDDNEERETVKVKDGVSEDSSIEEVEIVENGKERSRECNGDVGKIMELDGKVGEQNLQLSCSSGVSEDLTNANLKVNSASAGNVLDVVSLNRELDVLDLPSHKKLHDSAEKRNNKLSRLKFEIELYVRRLATFQLYHPTKKPDEDVVREPFVPLTKEEEDEVAHALSNAKRRVLVTHENSNIEITGELLQCLRPGAWLNDEVINVYLELLKEREKREPQKFLKCHFFSTFFYKKLIGGRSGYDFKSVRRWTTQRKLGYCLTECDKIFIPIHKEIHWCLAVINKKDEKFQYLDSLKGSDKHVMKVLARYFMDEVKDKSGKEFDVSSWKQEYVEDLPEQENGFDCGVFMIKYADFYSRDVGLCFNQEHMPYFRRRTAKEVLRLKAE